MKNKTSPDPMRGIFQRGRIYYYQPPQEDKVRPPMITLETDDIDEAISLADQIRKIPLLTPSAKLLAEVKEFLAEKTRYREYTRSTAEAKLQKLKRWIDSLPARYTLTQISTPLLKQQYDEVLEATSPATAHKFLMDVRAFLRWALEKRKLRVNPAIGVKEVDVPHSPRVLFCSFELRDKLIGECPREDLRYVLNIGFHAGLRKNEIIQSVPAWILFEPGVLDLRDTTTFRFNDKKRRRKIPMRLALRDFLGVYGLREPFMLRPDVKQGKGIYRYDFAKPFRDYMKEQGVAWVTPHVMRHTMASLLVMGDKKRGIKPVSIYKVAKWLGDTVKVTEDTYAHLSPQDPDIEETGNDSPDLSRSMQESMST